MSANSSFGQTPGSDRPLLLHPSTQLSWSPENSPGSTLVDPRSPPLSQPRQRVGYHQLHSDSSSSQRFDDFADGDIGSSESAQGLGITGQHGRNQSLVSEPADDEDRDQFVSGGSVRSIPFSFANSTRPLTGSVNSLHKIKASDSTLPRGASIKSQKAYTDFVPQMYCASREHIWKGAGDHVYITLLILSIFSTIFSGIYLGIALAKPRYGRFISDDGNLTASDASTLFQFFAKLIELSFVTVFIAFVGQVISRRAFNRSKSHGVTLAEISMRGWIMQPGQMIVHPETVKYGAISVIGLLALLAALTGMLYTTAAATLVVPQVSLGGFIKYPMQGLVTQAFGDMQALSEACASPAYDAGGWSVKAQTCVGPQLTAQANTDLSKWLAQWTIIANTSQGSDDLHFRPPGYALVTENTTVSAPWIEIQNMTEVSTSYQRTVNNVSLALPNTAVIDAASHPINKLLQPKADNNGLGDYNIQASVYSPALNVLCAELNATEIIPMVYSNWTFANKSIDYANWTNLAQFPEYVPSAAPDEWLNNTVVDQVFGWGPEFGERRMPVFARPPSVYNIIINSTGTYAPLPNRDAMYTLAGIPDAAGNLKNYSLCSIRAYRTANCSTMFNATAGSGWMTAHCEDPNDEYQFSKHVNATDLKQGNDTTSILWVDMADQWASATSLGGGISDSDGSDSRLLTQFFPQTWAYNASTPSMAEALAVMASGTLLSSSRNAPLTVMSDNAKPLNQNTTENFSAQVQLRQYASGAQNAWQNVFFIVLFVVFAGNVMVLIWLILNRGLVTDFSDPANMFSLTINSPPSHLFAGSCGGGPQGKQYEAKWYVNVDGDHVFIANDERDNELAENRLRSKQGSVVSTVPSPIMQTYSKLSKRRSVL